MNVDAGSPLTSHTPELSETLDRLAALVLRRRWWFLVSAFVVAVGVALGSFLLPNRYKSEATILVEEQQIPERYVVPNTTADVDEMLQAMRHDVLSRPRLLKLVSEFDLYPGDRKQLGPEQLAERMRADIDIEPLERTLQTQKGVKAFKISYVGANPRTVQQVTQQLTSLFIDEDLRTQEQRDVTTTTFLGSQLAAAQADLDEKEKRLRDFKMANLGELPEEQAGNLEILNGLEQQLQNVNEMLARANEQRAYIESLSAQYRNLTQASGSASPSLDPLTNARAELNRLQIERSRLLGTFSSQYPDVRKVDRQIAETQALIAKLQSAQTPLSSGNSTSSSAGADGAATDMMMNGELELKIFTSRYTARAHELEEQISDYQHRLNLTPVREQQLTDILRYYDLAKKNYDDLYAKKTQSALATDLQQSQQGEQFKLIDPPNLPSKPSSPDRLRIALGGLVAAIGIGLGLAYLIELRDASFHTEKELLARCTFPIAMGLPLFISPSEQRKRSVMSVVQWCAGAMMLLGVVAAEYYVYWRG